MIDKTSYIFVAFGTITTGPCAGDSFGRYGIYPYKLLNRCVAGKCILTEFQSSIAWQWTLGPKCGLNACGAPGYDKYLFPSGLE